LLVGSGAAATDEIDEQSENRKIEDGIDANGDAEKPAESPCERFVCGRHDEFRNLQARRKKGNQGDRQIGFAGDRPG